MISDIENDIKVDGVFVGLPKILKRLDFVEDLNSFVRRFTKIYIENNSIFIGHTINNNKTKIEFKDLTEWIIYFDRI